MKREGETLPLGTLRRVSILRQPCRKDGFWWYILGGRLGLGFSGGSGLLVNMV